jgi:hypothetical protein
MVKKPRGNSIGSSLAELAAALVIVLPLLVLALFITIEASQAYLIKNGLNDATRQAARDLAKAYNQDIRISSDRSLQESTVLRKISVPGVLNSPAQFSVEFREGASPPNVIVTATYEGGKYGLPPYPTLNLLHLNNPTALACQSVYRLE